jgi:poly(3-hydroxybutyrate) depolymerase
VTVLGGTIDVDGTLREYMLVLPDGYDHDTPYPLVFGWHGLGGHSELAQSIYQLETYWPAPAIVVYPQGLPQVGPDTGWDLNENGVDMAFFDAMATSFANELCVDLDRIYTMGFSFGAYMSNHLACYRGDYLRGMAAVSGGGPFPGDTCQGPVAAMIVHGTEDNVVPYAEGEASRDRWLAEDGCSMDTTMWLPDDAKQMPECFDYQGCDAGAPVTWCSHIWQHVWRPWMNVEIPAFLAGL